MSMFRELGREVAGDQERRSRQLDITALQAGLAHAVARLPRRRAVRRSGFALAACTSAAAAGLALVWYEQHPTPEFWVAGNLVSAHDRAWISAPPDSVVPIDFRDGSRVMLTNGAQARIAKVERNETKIELERGRAELDIVPRPGKHWQVDVGPYVIKVTGTRFDVEWNAGAEQVTLRMREGKVLVAGCGIDSKALSGSEVFHATCKQGQDDVGIEPPPPDGGAGPRTRPSDQPPTTLEPAVAESRAAHVPGTRGDKSVDGKNASTAGASITPSWRELAHRGRYAEALAAVEALGFDAQCERLPSADLLVLGNAARIAGHAAQSNRAFLVLRKRFPGDTAASVAAFNIARVAFDLAGDYPQAVKWFQTYLKERPTGSLAREAHGRLMESLQRARDGDGARQCAASYLSRYPDGPHAELARQLLE